MHHLLCWKEAQLFAESCCILAYQEYIIATFADSIQQKRAELAAYRLCGAGDLIMLLISSYF